MRFPHTERRIGGGEGWASEFGYLAENGQGAVVYPLDNQNFGVVVGQLQGVRVALAGLQEQGYTVIRYKNVEYDGDPEGVTISNLIASVQGERSGLFIGAYKCFQKVFGQPAQEKIFVFRRDKVRELEREEMQQRQAISSRYADVVEGLRKGTTNIIVFCLKQGQKLSKEMIVDVRAKRLHDPDKFHTRNIVERARSYFPQDLFKAEIEQFPMFTDDYAPVDRFVSMDG